KYLLLPQWMDGWSPTYQAGRVKVIGRLINLTPSGSVNSPSDSFPCLLSSDHALATPAELQKKNSGLGTEVTAKRPENHRPGTFKGIPPQPVSDDQRR